MDKVTTGGREALPFVSRAETPGAEDEILAAAVPDASGTRSTPNLM